MFYLWFIKAIKRRLKTGIMTVHYQAPSNNLNQTNAQIVTIDGFNVLVAKQIGETYKATFMNGYNFTQWYNDEYLHDTVFTSFDAAVSQCKEYVGSILESAYESANDL